MLGKTANRTFVQETSRQKINFNQYDMRNFLILLLTTLILSACNNDPKQKLIGEWKEHWGIGQETDVNYNDIIKIQLTTDGNFVMTCMNRNNYFFDKIIFDGIELSFREENTQDPNEKFYVYYKLKLSSDGKWMEGTISNSKGQTDNIKCEKVNK